MFYRSYFIGCVLLFLVLASGLQLYITKDNMPVLGGQALTAAGPGKVERVVMDSST